MLQKAANELVGRQGGDLLAITVAAVALAEVHLAVLAVQELQAVCGPLGLPIERDLCFEPCRVSA